MNSCVFVCTLVCYSERRLWHVTEGLFSLTCALHFRFVPDGTGHARASVSHSGNRHWTQKA